MIEEQFVSFDTAKMLKEAGFDEVCSWAYYRAYNWCLIHERNSKLCLGYYSRPTQALAARWLREVHRIVVDVTFIPPLFDGVNWQYFIGNMDDMVWEGDFEPSERKYATYEEALEAGLKHCLELIKK